MSAISGLVLAVMVAAAIQPASVDDAPDVSDADLAPTISDIELPVSDIVLSEPKDVVTERVDQGQRVLDLTADVLFEFDSAVVVPAGVTRVGELVADLSQGAAVAIGGRTDAIGDDASNHALSQQRAEAVATIVRTARPDLALTVTGYGESQPVAPNTNGAEDNPEGRALNRRVELRVG